MRRVRPTEPPWLENPRRDTPAVLKRWAAQAGAGPGWTFLTGEPADVQRLRRALGFTSRYAEDNAHAASRHLV